ncbi:hypothetical protein S245_069903, partial [Arachis hypogaea]
PRQQPPTLTIPSLCFDNLYFNFDNNRHFLPTAESALALLILRASSTEKCKPIGTRKVKAVFGVLSKKFPQSTPPTFHSLHLKHYLLHRCGCR